MTIFNNRELDKLFDDITNRFFDSDNISETIKAGCSSGSICYGYTITIGSDGKPVVKEYGNAKPSRSTTLDNTLVDTIVDETNEQLKLVAEMPGVEKEDMESVRKLLESIPNVMDLSNNRLVRIKITVSEESRADVGSSVIGLLHGNGIEFVDAYFSQENMIITFNREDASRAYDVLRSEIG